MAANLFLSASGTGTTGNTNAQIGGFDPPGEPSLDRAERRALARRITRRLASLALLAGVLVAQSAHGQCTAVWSQPGASTPGPRGAHTMVFDTSHAAAVLFGGTTGALLLGDTWLRNGTTWNEVLGAGPPARADYGMAWDSVRNQAVLFGGRGDSSMNGGQLDDTWVFDGTSWAQRIVSGPGRRTLHAMAFDSVRGVAVLFGGAAQGIVSPETWEWNGSAWSLIPATPPSPDRVPGGQMAFDPVRGRTVLYGGESFNGSLEDTWEWDGAAWTQRSASGPPPRFRPVLAWAPSIGKVVMFGGSIAGQPSGEVWAWDGFTWSEIDTGSGPDGRYVTAMCFDSARDVLLVNGGVTASGYVGDTWELAFDIPDVAEVADAIECPSGVAAFSALASGVGPFTYQWQIQTAPGVWQGLGNDPGPIPCPGGGSGFAFATPINSPTVNIGVHGCPGAQHWQVRAIATNACGSVTSNEATLLVCPADFDCSGAVNSQDFFTFLAAFFALEPAADFNHSGAIDSQDFFDMLAAFFAGC